MQSQKIRWSVAVAIIALAGGAVVTPNVAMASTAGQDRQVQPSGSAVDGWSWMGQYDRKSDCVARGKTLVKDARWSDYRCTNRSRPHAVPIWNLSAKRS